MLPNRLSLIVCLALIGCSGGSSTTKCPTGTLPCGNGCRPSGTICCEDTFASSGSSYCTNSAGGGCFANTRSCQAGFPANTAAKFCCATSGTIGSNDCPAGQHHCGLLCSPIGTPCCPANASAQDCPTETNAAPAAVDCGCCSATGACYHCLSGQCCAGGDLCTNSGTCIPNQAVCVGVSAGGGGGGVCAYWSCGSSSQCASVMGAPSGVQCTFAAGQTCQQWCTTYVPGNCSCR